MAFNCHDELPSGQVIPHWACCFALLQTSVPCFPRWAARCADSVHLTLSVTSTESLLGFFLAGDTEASLVMKLLGLKGFGLASSDPSIMSWSHTGCSGGARRSGTTAPPCWPWTRAGAAPCCCGGSCAGVGSLCCSGWFCCTSGGIAAVGMGCDCCLIPACCCCC